MRYLLALDLILAAAGYVCGAPPQAPIPPQAPAAVCPGGVCPVPVAYTGTVCGPSGCTVSLSTAQSRAISRNTAQSCYTCSPQFARGGLFGWRRR